MIDIINEMMNIFRQGFPCLFQLITGLYCPGCGGTRAVKYLLHGELQKSFQYHPLVLYMAVVIAAEAVSWGISKIFKNPALHIKRYELFTYVGVAIVLGNWVFKNYMLVMRGIDLLP